MYNVVHFRIVHPTYYSKAIKLRITHDTRGEKHAKFVLHYFVTCILCMTTYMNYTFSDLIISQKYCDSDSSNLFGENSFGNQL